MTDSTPTPPTPEPAATPAAPAYAAAPVAAGPTQTLSIVGFILGIASVVFSWTGIIGIGAGIAAIIVSNRAKKQEPGAPSWMHTVGLITGIVGIVLGLILGIITIVGFIASFLVPAAVLNGVNSY
ncbi:MAG TPA: DUF4190 domain-containing protein [Pseudolysinimonas sp.]|jgi:hypothetical protein